MRKLFIPLMLTFAIGFTSCSVDVNGSNGTNGEDGSIFFNSERIKASNTIVDVVRNVGNFSGLDVASALSVKITDSKSDGKISLYGPDNVISQIETVVNGDILKIRLKKNINYGKQKVVITIPHQKLRSINLSGASSIEADHQIKVEDFKGVVSGASDLDFAILANRVDLNLSGASDVEFKGNVQDLKLEISGASDFKSKELKVANAWVKASGASTVYVWAVDKIDVSASGASSVYYKNSSAIKTNFSSSGAAHIKTY